MMENQYDLDAIHYESQLDGVKNQIRLLEEAAHSLENIIRSPHDFINRAVFQVMFDQCMMELDLADSALEALKLQLRNHPKNAKDNYLEYAYDLVKARRGGE